MIVFGFDPGSIRFGVGILEKQGNRITYLHSEVISLKEKDFYLKMKSLLLRLDELYNTFSPDCAAIEEGFLGKNVKSMNVLSKVRGVVLGSLILRDIGLTSYSPREIKMALTGSGAAAKSQVADMVKRLLNIKNMKLSSDAGDALGVAYCHLLHSRKF
ncbi:MAG: crossover junction endodeoxyribonuclease RuvC [bacterium]|nr:crossover junction endodeoxyribonuclease RuvC [bacterium]